MNKVILLMFLALFLVVSCGDIEPTNKEKCDKLNCSEKQECKFDNSKAKCECKIGFDLVYGECIENKCFNFQCKENEQCSINEEDEANCVCTEGFQLEGDTCTKIPTECNEITCEANQKCIVDELVPSCICNDGFYDKENICTFDCREIEGAKANNANNGCICENSNNYINIEEAKCLLKEGCNLDEVDCGENGQCKEDLEKDWSCDCNEGYYFDNTTCVKESKCEENQTECGEICCGQAEICLNDSTCKILSVLTCQDDGDCLENQFCDPIADKCIEMQDEEGCIFKPSPNQAMNPLLAWQWPNENTPEATFKHVIMSPVVINLTDDNNDGLVNLKDTPDIIFSSYTGTSYTQAYLRIIDGKTGLEIDTYTTKKIDGGSGIAAGDLDNDNKNEIVTINNSGDKVIVFEYDDDFNLVEKWSTAFSFGGGETSGMPSIADINHDGNPEVIVGNYIFNGADGTVKCHSTDPLISFGYNNWKRYSTIVEDINNDGTMDIITGNQFISGVDCTRIAAREDRDDGFTAIADLNLDGSPEVVVVSKGYLYIYDKNMLDLVTPLQVDIGDAIGGPPTIGNFDEDAELEIAVAGTTEYRVIDIDLSTQTAEKLWGTATQDASSRMTGSSLFDFEGDGIAEVLYADECHFMIYNGEDGSERLKIKNSSATILEYPLVVDADNDGKSEILLVANAGHNNICSWGGQAANGNFGIRMFESPDNTWVRTRRIWNQHSYHVTNVNEDGSIPINEEHNWLSYNNYRLNVQGKGVFNTPNFVIDRVEVERIDCPKLSFKLKIKLTNKGSLSINPDLPVSIYKNTNNTKTLITTLLTTEILLPGVSTTLIYEFTPETPDKLYSLSVIADDKGNGSGEYNECNELDNSKIINFKGAYTAFCQAGVGECMKFAPYICDENNELTCGATAGNPETEICDDGFDNNCDGNIDENCSCNTQEQDCYHASSDLLAENSRCQKGKMYCIGGESWGTCENDILPIVELCNGEDDDCDGDIDEEFSQLGETCYLGLGECKQPGTFVCSENGNMICNALPLNPEIEICDDEKDNNCNGITDESPCQSIE